MFTLDEKRVCNDISKEGSFEHLIDEYSALQLGERAATEDSLGIVIIIIIVENNVSYSPKTVDATEDFINIIVY